MTMKLLKCYSGPRIQRARTEQDLASNELKCIASINNCYAPVGVDQVIEGEKIKALALEFRKIPRIPGALVLKPFFDGHVIEPSPIWRHGAKVLHFQGLDDQCMPPELGRKFQQAIPQEFRDNCSLIEYPDAGHMIEPPYMPLCKSSFNTMYGQYLIFGGKPKPHADAQEDSWFKILNFLHKHLKTDVGASS